MWSSDLQHKLDGTDLNNKEEVYELLSRIIRTIEWIEEDMRRLDRVKQDEPGRELDSW